MNRLVDDRGQIILFGRKLGSGGEGAVYEISQARDLVAKVYHRPLSKEKEQKLSLMSRIGRPELSEVAAWPVTILRDRIGGPMRGIIMPRVDAPEIHDLYGPRHRAIHFPAADWRFLVRAALNTAVAFDILHRNGIVIGDVNENVVKVSSQATVKLIDCDSFQIQFQGQLHKCIVGVPNFTPPELQSIRNFASVVRTTNHDNFGLAVLIFHLLFMGRHPFSGRFAGPGDMPIERAISEYRFAYSMSNSRTQMSPPPNSLALSEASVAIAHLFERAFGHGAANPNARPTAREWKQELISLERQIQKCHQDAGHYHVMNQRCPWCRLVAESGKNFFISVTLKATLHKSASFNLSKAWAAIEAAPRPGYVLADRSVKNRLTPTPFNIVDPNSSLRRMTGWVSTSSAVLTLLGLFAPIIAIFSGPIAVVFLCWWVVLWLTSAAKKEKGARKKHLRVLEREFSNVQDLFGRASQGYMQQFESKLEALRSVRRSYEQLYSERQQELNDLQQRAKEQQLEEYLGQCFIRGAKIPGIGPGRINTLESYGIECADDITASRVSQVPGFGPVLTRELVAWRVARERQFCFDPSKGVPAGMVGALEMKYLQRRTSLEHQLTAGPEELIQIVRLARAELSRLDQEVARVEIALAQAKCDFAVV